jgi:hypothetical protein
MIGIIRRRQMKKLQIANLNIETGYIDEQFFNYRYRKYEISSFMKADMILKAMALEEVAKPEGVLIEQIDDAAIIRMRDNRLCRYLSDNRTGKITSATYYNDNYDEVEIHLLKDMWNLDFSMTEFEYMYTGFAFSDRLTELGGAILHGSSIAYDNQGIIFSANSGTGKSTHTKLWNERFGSKVTIVNDDKPAIRFYDGVPFIFGTPWSGKSDLNANVQVELKALVFIRQAETNWIKRLNTRDSIFNLMSQISRPYYDEKIGLKTMEIIDKLVQAVPCYILHCNISQEAVDVVYNQLLKEGIVEK